MKPGNVGYNLSRPFKGVEGQQQSYSPKQDAVSRKTMNVICIISAIIGIMVIELYALSQGIDGVALSGGLAIIGGLGGYSVRSLVKKKD